MNNVLEMILQRYNPRNSVERENAIKEIIQEIVLSGLSKGGFFDNAAFYGGTCLRIFHGLNRFSEDLDFAVTSNTEVNLEKYFPFIKKELLSYGLEMEINLKEKAQHTDIKSAFVNGNALMLMMQFFPKSNESKLFIGDQKIRIKFEVDTQYVSGGLVENRYQLNPSPYEITIFDESTLFAGKLHAIICRNYKNNVKGRDYYDYLFYLSKGTKINLTYLENKLKKTGVLANDDSLTIEKVKNMLKEKFLTVDFDKAKEDVSRFIENSESLNMWSSDFFISTLDKLITK